LGRKQIFAVNYRRFCYALESGTQMSLDFSVGLSPGERVIAIGGTGHMAILKQLLAIDTPLEGVPVNSYF
jgi:hypothetical protein